VERVRWARELARRVLAEALPVRWSHTQGVVRAAEAVSEVVGEDAWRLVSAAWLHDIGYAPDLAVTKFHPLDGARYLRDVAHADPLVCRLVANHSCASLDADLLGLAGALAAEFPPFDGLLADALTFADMTTTPTGDSVTVDERLAEILRRYGAESDVADSIAEARPEIMRAAGAVTASLAALRDRR
jgi:HD superfamily phosphodiesterase